MAGRCNARQHAQDAWDAENTFLASGRNADGSDAGSVFADIWSPVMHVPHMSCCGNGPIGDGILMEILVCA